MSPDNGGVAVTERLNHLRKVDAESREGTGFDFPRPAYAFQTFYAALQPLATVPSGVGGFPIIDSPWKSAGCGRRAQVSMAEKKREPDLMAAPKNGAGEGTGTAVATKPKTKTKKPNLYRVLLLNDDYTPMEFVIHVLERFFNKNRDDATRIMMHVHQNGVGECGVFTYEVAETKVTQVMDFARRHQHPLQCVMEKK
jgi:ATP-dependent Clp protease adaptor protein ClpS